MREFVVPIRPRYGEVDSMGVVYHAHYLVYFDIARTEYMRDRGAPYTGIEDLGLRLAVVGAQVHYIRPARYDQEIVVAVWVSAVAGASVTFEYQLRDAAGTTLATGLTRLACLGPSDRPTRLPADFIQALGAPAGRIGRIAPSETS